MLPRATLRFVGALAASVALVVLGALAGGSGCGPDSQTEVWVCLNPITGKEDPNTYDANHYVNGVFDPCHCYDPCGPEKSCPDVVDAGPPPPGCDGGSGGGSGTGGGAG